MMIKHINEYYNNGKTLAKKRTVGRPRKQGERSASGRLTERPCDSQGPEGHFVYFIQGSFLAVKVGRSSNLKSRLAGIQNASAETVRVIGLIDIASVEDANKIERFLHREFKAAGRHIGGEWFRLDLGDIEEACARCEREFPAKAKTSFVVARDQEEEQEDHNATYVSGSGFTGRNHGLR